MSNIFSNALVKLIAVSCFISTCLSCTRDSQCGYNWSCNDNHNCTSDWPLAVTYVLGIFGTVIICFGGAVARMSHFGPPDSGFQWWVLCLALTLTIICVLELVWCPSGLVFGIITCIFAVLFWIQFINLCIYFRKHPMGYGGAGFGPPGRAWRGRGRGRGRGGWRGGPGGPWGGHPPAGAGGPAGPPPPPPPPLFCCWWCDDGPYYEPVYDSDINNNQTNETGQLLTSNGETNQTNGGTTATATTANLPNDRL